MILAPLRGVTTRCFRRVFADILSEAGFDEAVTPFVSAVGGADPLVDRELSGGPDEGAPRMSVTPQFIGKDPDVLRRCLERLRAAGWRTADLNCGCPFPMVRRKGRGSGLLRTPEVLRRMLETGCDVMGEGRFSVKMRLGVERPDELLALVPLLNEFPLRRIVVHARTARQMYDGETDPAALAAVAAAARAPVVPNGDLDWRRGEGMVGRSFVRDLGARADAAEQLLKYVDESLAELHGERPVLGRIKELVAYWRELPQWRRRWGALKICRSLAELRAVVK